MTIDELKSIIRDPEAFRELAYDVLRDIATLYARAADENDESQRQAARDLVIRSLERRDEMGGARDLHDALLIQVGLFPYIDDPESLPLADQLLVEAHRPL